MGNYVGEIWRGMRKVSISTIPVSRREGGGGGGGHIHAQVCEVCSRDTTSSKCS